ncbi:MAG: NnrS family protein [Rhizobacter sp.]|nr:NnrS family protein [Rhizobacter sp.]
MGRWAQRIAAAPLLASGFRPFYLLGALYAPLLAAGSAGAYFGIVDLDGTGGRVLWHGHEMLFGFAGAIIAGTLLTALPSWAGLAEQRGAPLAALVAAWLLGRIAFWAAPWLPALVVAVADLLLWPALLVLLGPGLWRAPNRLYRLLLPILLALTVANAAYHAAALAGNVAGAAQALHGAVWVVAVLYSLKGGLLTSVFTGNALRALGRGEPTRVLMPLETSALALLLALAAADLAALPWWLSGTLAAACAAAHGARVLRWRGWRVADQPMLPAMHLGFAWFVFALVLKAVADLSGLVPQTAWLHAFSVGALGMMMLGLMTRVSLRHTGRALDAQPLLRAAAAGMFAAAALRLAAGVHDLGAGVVALSALVWACAFAAYLLRFAAVLVRPSLPRQC